MLHLKRASLRRAFVWALAALMLAALTAGCGKKTEPESGLPGAGQGQVIATYKGGDVTQGEFDKYMAFMAVQDPQTEMYLQIPQFKEQFVRQLALYKAFSTRASDEQLKAADQQVKDFEKNINDAIKQNAQLKDQLKTRNLTVEEMKRIVKVLASGSEIPKAKQTELANAVTDADIKAEYDKKASDFNIITVRHILIGTVDPQTKKQLRTDEEALKRAKEVKDKLDKGGDWKALAKEYSDDPGSKENGGLYEKQEAKSWVGGFKDAANKQEIGKIGDPVQTEFGYHVMKVESREATPFDKVSKASKDELKTSVVNTKMQKFMDDESKAIDLKVTLPAAPAPSASGSPSPSPSPSAPASASAGK